MIGAFQCYTIRRPLCIADPNMIIVDRNVREFWEAPIFECYPHKIDDLSVVMTVKENISPFIKSVGS